MASLKKEPLKQTVCGSERSLLSVKAPRAAPAGLLQGFP